MKTWIADHAHSRIGFYIKHLTITEISGRFADFTATATCEKDDFSDAIFSFQAKAASIDTDVPPRDKHLQSSDFFDAEKFPDVTFASREITGLKNGAGTLKGDLTIRGITRPITLTVCHTGTVENPMSHKTTAGFRISGSLKRSDYQLGPTFPEAIISDTVNLDVHIECIAKE